LNVSVDKGVQREVAALTNPTAGVKSVAYLADEDISGSHLLAAESLHAATLRVRVTSVSAGALSLFVCHEITSPHEVVRGQIALAEAEYLAD